MFTCCPYLGSSFDRATPYIVPDNDNVCYAQLKRQRRFGIFTRVKVGVRIALSFQKTSCYASYSLCPAYCAKENRKQSSEAISEVG